MERRSACARTEPARLNPCRGSTRQTSQQSSGAAEAADAEEVEADYVTMWVSFDPRERTICGLMTMAGRRGAAINVSAQPLNKQQV